MAHLGKKVACGLLENDPGDPQDHSGWRGALQDAADLSRQDPGVLRVADEIHRAARGITTAPAVRAYAMSTLVVVPSGPGSWVLRGMLERLEAIAD